MTNKRWVAADWGTSNLRVWLMEQDRKVAEARSDKGMNSLIKADFELALLELVDPWLPVKGSMTILACGMVGARQGWQEAPYRAVPCRPAAQDAAMAVASQNERIKVFILPGLSQDEPADVMRGEETQIAGFLAKHPDFAGNLCLPGTHSKWIAIEEGAVTSFRTFMTGELFSLLAEHSVLRHSLGGEGADDQAFRQSVKDAFERSAEVPGRLFRLRAEDLLHGLPAATARARLSGTLIGAELAAALSNHRDLRLGLVSGGRLLSLYEDAISSLGFEVLTEEGEAMVLAGLISAHALLGNEDR